MLSVPTTTTNQHVSKGPVTDRELVDRPAVMAS